MCTSLCINICLFTCIQRNCVKALSLMVEHFEARPAILEAGGLSLLLEYLSSEYEIIQELVLKALHSCSHNGTIN